jgi:putative urate catabolism protein
VEGGENCVLHGDDKSENLLSEIVGAQAYQGQRHMNMETLYEYGSRSGFWRILRLFQEMKMAATVYAVGMALERNPDAAKAMVDAGFEIASHGYRWIDYQTVDIETERVHIQQSIEAIVKTTGTRPVGIYQGKPNKNTRALIVEEGGFLYDADSYSDDLPYWTYWQGPEKGDIRAHLVVPYSLDCNDMRFAQALEGERFFLYLRDAFDALYEEGLTAPKMMSIGLHCRIVGRPARIGALKRFMQYVAQHDDVWVCQRQQIAEHWHSHHRPSPPQYN